MVGILENTMETPEPATAAPPVDPSAAAAGVKRVKRLEKPDKAAVDKEVAQIHEQIDAIQARILVIKETIDAKLQNKQASSAEVQEAWAKVAELGASFRSVMEEKRALREELEAADKNRDSMRADARALREKLPFVKMEEIDEEVKKLEYRMTHTSLSLQQEKQLLQQVKELTKSKDFVKNYTDKEEQISQDQAARRELLDKINKKDVILNDLKAQREKQKAGLPELREKGSSQTEEVRKLIEERSEAFKKSKSLREEIKDLRQQFKNKENEYWNRERQWKEQLAIQKRKDYEKRDAERKEREKIRKQRELENFVEPYTDEIIMIDQLSSYLQKYLPTTEESASSAPQKAEVVAPKGVGNVIVSKKNKFDEDLDSWFSGKSKAKKTKVPAAAKSKGKEKLSLSLDALTSFSKAKLTAPTTVGDVAKTIEDLKSKKGEYQKLQAEARERREKGEPEVAKAVDVQEIDENEGEKEVTEETQVEDGESSLVAQNDEEPEKENGADAADSEPKEVEISNGDTTVPEVDSTAAESSKDEEVLAGKEDSAEVVDTVEKPEEEVGVAVVSDGEKREQLEVNKENATTGSVDSKLSEDLEAKLPEDLEA